MDRDIKLLKQVYERFNARDIDGVLAMLAEDVIWANGMDGGHIHGRESVRDYWTRQWSMVDPQVEPARFRKAADGSIMVEVRQSVRDLEGRPLQDETIGLGNRMVEHIFRMSEGRVARFDIGRAA